MESFWKSLEEGFGYARRLGLLLFLFWLAFYFGIEWGFMSAQHRESGLFIVVDWAGAAGLALVIMGALYWLKDVWETMASRLRQRRADRELDDRAVASLPILTRSEAETLLFIFENNLEHFQADVFSGEIMALRNKGILRQEHSSGLNRRTFKVADRVWEYKESWTAGVLSRGLAPPQHPPWSL